jgi:polysaccharide biosynthesis protein PslJ
VATSPQVAAPRRPVALAVVAVGAAAFALSLVLGSEAALGGAIVLLVACALAYRETAVPVVTWPNAVALLITLIWLLPIKTYRLPINLPFALEPYRVYILMLVFVWLLGLLAGSTTFRSDGHGFAFLAFAAVVFTTQIVNYHDINAASIDAGALKSMSYFLSFVLVFLLVTATIDSTEALDKLVRALVAGGTIVAVTALYDARSTYNVFDHLHQWIPVLEYVPREVSEERAGQLRVYGSAQHPIALSVALFMMVPLAIYLAGRAATVVRSRLWLTTALLCTAGGLATISRTTVAMAVAMGALAVSLRGMAVARFWPLLLAVPFVVHFLAPGTLGGLYKSIFPEEGLVSDLSGRAGQSGSGRLADLDPGLRIWSDSPLVGKGIGSQNIEKEDPTQVSPGQTPTEIIFDDQYLNSLVTTGALGLAAVVWVVWGTVAKLSRAARRRFGQPSDLLVACSVAAAGFAASMFLFDAFYFVQSTLLFFIIAAVGFRARTLSRPDPAAS